MPTARINTVKATTENEHKHFFEEATYLVDEGKIQDEMEKKITQISLRMKLQSGHSKIRNILPIERNEDKLRMPDIIYEINTDGNPFKEAQNKLKPEQKEKIMK